MTPERWQQISHVYETARARPAKERAAFLAEACGSDDALRREVETLLDQPTSPGFLEGLTPTAVAAVMGSGTGAPMTGRRLGGYLVGERLGAGGMGEVYRARDTQLGRDVAIKILPRAFTSDPNRLARFEREARMLAALDHPNIGTIYGVEESDGIRALVLGLVEGDTLAQRIGRGPIPMAEALEYAKQIADALETAHEKGIVHRDLKPANTKITPAGIVKVLDFGLAKVALGDGSNPEAPTATRGATREGMILGTAAYMSPEQARGKPVDKRADIWAFGCVLYEMLTGRVAFGGDTTSDTIAKILEREPDWSALPAATPASVTRLAQRCLQKDPKRRLRDIGDARVELDEPSSGELTLSIQPAGGARPRGQRYLGWWSVALVLLVALSAAILFWSVTGEAPVSLPVARTVIVLPPDQKLASGSSAYPLAVSRDGTRLAYVTEREGRVQLHVRELSELEATAIPGTSGARHPFFSPDGQWVGFFADGALQKVAVVGGAPLRVCNVPSLSMGASWGPDDTIVFALAGDTGLLKVNAAGGTPEPLAGSGPAAWPEILPDGRTVLFTTGVTYPEQAIATMSLGGGGRHIVARMDGSPLQGPAALGGAAGDIHQARFVPTGHLVYGQDPGIVRAIPFDPTLLTITGSPVSIVDSVERARGGGAVYFGVSRTGLLVYASTGDSHQLAWVDRNGTATPISADRAAFRMPRLSPDGKRIAVSINDETTRRSNIWIYDAERGTKNRFTTDYGLGSTWTPDGTRITFDTGDTIAEMPADGSGSREILLNARDRGVESWSPDGHHLLFHAREPTGFDLWVLPRSMGNVPRPLLVRPFNDQQAQFSPDGRWVAYVSDESGRDEVYVGPYADLGRKVAVSTDSGAHPRWSRDGRELFYRQNDALMAVAVDTSRGVPAGKPQRLFTGAYSGAGRGSSFDVAPDGQRFVMVKSDEASRLQQLTVVQNWTEELKRLVPTK